MNIKQWLIKTTSNLSTVENPKKEAETLLKFIIKKSFSWIKLFEHTELNNKQITKLNLLVTRRKIGEPIAYIIKNTEFWSLNFEVSNISMIPRIDSEVLVEKTLKLIPQMSFLKILDLGCGCGSLSIALASERKNCLFIGVDYNDKLISLSKKNSKKIKVNNVNFIKSNWFNKLKNHFFDVIISNPPYIDINDPHLLKGDLLFEPINSLVAKENGLHFIKLITNTSIKFLKPNGCLIFEHGWNQGNKVRKILTKNNFIKIFTYQDYSGLDRVTSAIKI